MGIEMEFLNILHATLRNTRKIVALAPAEAWRLWLQRWALRPSQKKFRIIFLDFFWEHFIVGFWEYFLFFLRKKIHYFGEIFWTFVSN